MAKDLQEIRADIERELGEVRKVFADLAAQAAKAERQVAILQNAIDALDGKLKV